LKWNFFTDFRAAERTLIFNLLVRNRKVCVSTREFAEACLKDEPMSVLGNRIDCLSMTEVAFECL
jgi:hypothetical protein